MPDNHIFVAISVDSLEWTRHWLGRLRCDLLGVFVATDSDTRPAVRIVAVESKSSAETTPLPVRLDTPQFEEASQQVTATLDALENVLCPEAGVTLFADLKLAAFFEHLTSEVLARINPISSSDSHKFQVLNNLSRLSKREFGCDSGLILDGLAVVTQHAATVPVEKRQTELQGARRSWPISLVRCGVPYLRNLFEKNGLAQLVNSGLLPEDETPVGPETMGAEQSDETKPAEQVITRASPGDSDLDENTQERITQLEAALKLRGFRIGDIEPANVRSGPTLISVSVELAAGESVRPIQSASRDIARELGVPSIVVENDPSRPYYLRFLVPRADRVFVPIPTERLPSTDAEHERYLGIWLGAEVDGTPYATAISEWPHLLVAGTTGSGKTTFLKSILTQLNRLPIGSFKVAVVDGKGEYDYLDFVHAEHFTPKFPEVLLGHSRATEVLKWLVEEEVDARRKVLTDYFRSQPNAPRAPKQAYIQALSTGAKFPITPIVVFVDEFAEIMLAAGKTADEFERLVQRAVQAGRSALVHLLLATQRPDANVLPGAIKANLPSRVALALPTHHDSMTVLGSAGAEELLGRGDLLFEPSSGGRVRLQAYRP